MYSLFRELKKKRKFAWHELPSIESSPDSPRALARGSTIARARAVALAGAGVVADARTPLHRDVDRRLADVAIETGEVPFFRHYESASCDALLNPITQLAVHSTLPYS